jgi:hypothetical protein
LRKRGKEQDIRIKQGLVGVKKNRDEKQNKKKNQKELRKRREKKRMKNILLAKKKTRTKRNRKNREKRIDFFPSFYVACSIFGPAHPSVKKGGLFCFLIMRSRFTDGPAHPSVKKCGLFCFVVMRSTGTGIFGEGGSAISWHLLSPCISSISLMTDGAVASLLARGSPRNRDVSDHVLGIFRKLSMRRNCNVPLVLSERCR